MRNGDENSKVRIAFLFGAGAEGKGNFNMPTGYQYLKQTILLREDSDDEVSATNMTSALSSFFAKSKTDGYFSELTSEETSVKNGYHYTAHLFSDDGVKKRLYAEYFLDRKPKINCLPEKVNISCKTIIDTESKKKDVIADIKGSFEGKNDEKTQFYKSCEQSFFTELKDAPQNLEVNAYIAGILDSYFHTIINPVRFGEQRFSKIFNFYWACYFSIVTGVLSNVQNFDTKYFTNGKISYEQILKNISDFTSKLYSRDNKGFKRVNSYYNCIKKRFETENETPNKKYSFSGIITTNYFDFAERELTELVDNSSENFAYPNGALKFFEFPELLEVKDLMKEKLTEEYEKKELFFPFMFGQSYVKPIVHPTQIEEFRKVKSILENSDYLVILGYNINEDDMHLNAFLHDFLTNGTVVVVSDSKESDIKPKIQNRLRNWTDKIKICEVSYGDNNKVIDKVFSLLNQLGTAMKEI